MKKKPTEIFSLPTIYIQAGNTAAAKGLKIEWQNRRFHEPAIPFDLNFSNILLMISLTTLEHSIQNLKKKLTKGEFLVSKRIKSRKTDMFLVFFQKHSSNTCRIRM